MTATTFDRIAAKAVTFPSPLKVLFSILAAPFYAVGWILGVLWWVVSLAYAAVLVGKTDADKLRNRRQAE